MLAESSVICEKLRNLDEGDESKTVKLYLRECAHLLDLIAKVISENV